MRSATMRRMMSRESTRTPPTFGRERDRDSLVVVDPGRGEEVSKSWEEKLLCEGFFQSVGRRSSSSGREIMDVRDTLSRDRLRISWSSDLRVTVESMDEVESMRELVDG